MFELVQFFDISNAQQAPKTTGISRAATDNGPEDEEEDGEEESFEESDASYAHTSEDNSELQLRQHGKRTRQQAASDDDDHHDLGRPSVDEEDASMRQRRSSHERAAQHHTSGPSSPDHRYNTCEEMKEYELAQDQGSLFERAEKADLKAAIDAIELGIQNGCCKTLEETLKNYACFPREDHDAQTDFCRYQSIIEAVGSDYFTIDEAKE